MNRTVDLSFLNRDFELYVQQWNKLGYSAAMMLPTGVRSFFGVVIDTEVLVAALRNKHRCTFPLDAVLEQCPFKNTNWEAWSSFISMFTGPPEIADQHTVSGYEE
jgi:hypothetical protein